jgi:hypothetical protein
MGRKSTWTVRKSDAMTLILKRLASGRSNKELEAILECFEEESTFENYMVVNDDDETFAKELTENEANVDNSDYLPHSLITLNGK